MDTNADRGGRLGPLAETQFRRLYLARALSLFGDALVPVALAFGVLAVDRSPSALGFVLASRFASLVLFLLVVGVIADRLPRKGILIGSDLVRLAAQSITASILVTSTATVWELVLLAFVYGAGEAFFRPTSTGFVPETISPARLQQANALLAATTSACTVLGPAVAGVMVATMGPGWAIVADAFTFFLSAMFLARIRTARRPGRQKTPFLRDLADGWRVFRSETWLWVDGVYSALGNCAVFAPFLLSLLALPTALLALPAPTVVIAVGALAGGFGLSVFNTLFATTIQQFVAPEALSRVASIDWFMSLGLFPIGFAVAGPAAAAFGVRVPLVAAAVWILGSTAIVLAVPSVRQVRLIQTTALN